MTSIASELTIQDDFPPVSWQDWRTIVEETLNGAPFERRLVSHTPDGIDVQPLYTRELADSHRADPGDPGQAPFIRGADTTGAVIQGWDIRPEYSHPDRTGTNRAILEDLQGGATSVLIRLDRAASEGLDPADGTADGLVASGGVMIFSASDLADTLAGVHLSMVQIALDAGAAFLPAAAFLVDVWKQNGMGPRDARGAFNADPLAILARYGSLPVSVEAALGSLADLARWTDTQYPQVTAVSVNSAPWHDAGATPAQDIAFSVAAGIEYLRCMTAAGLDINRAAKQIVFRFCLGTHHFQAIAKLRAARAVWSRVIESCGGSGAAQAMRIHARIGNRVLTKRDPYVNLLRNTVAVFAAGLGGAETITSVPFDSLVGQPDAFSRRIARNTVLVLQEEAHLNRVLDPAGGSWFLDSLTNQTAEAAWKELQEIEQQGGLIAALRSGWAASRLNKSWQRREQEISHRKTGITGISEFPNVAESPVGHPVPDPGQLHLDAISRTAHRMNETAMQGWATHGNRIDAAVDAARRGATIGQIARALDFHAEVQDQSPVLSPRRLAENFEQLRDASDRWQSARGRRPRVFLASLGPVAHHTARASWSKNFFEAGGFEVVSNDGFANAESAAAAFASSDADVAVICSSDKLYPDLVPSTAAQLRAAGARSIVLAGNPGDNESAWRSAGVDRFIFLKCDVLQTLRDVMQELGVLSTGRSV